MTALTAAAAASECAYRNSARTRAVPSPVSTLDTGKRKVLLDAITSIVAQPCLQGLTRTTTSALTEELLVQLDNGRFEAVLIVLDLRGPVAGT